MPQKYQVSLEGYKNGQHAQLSLHDCASLEAASLEASTRAHLPHASAEKSIAILFKNKEIAIEDGVPADKIEKLSSTYRWIVTKL